MRDLNIKDSNIISGLEKDEDTAIDLSLRPKDFSEYIGQETIKRNLQISINAAKSRHETLEHILLYGAPGLGKTTLAHIIAEEMGVNIKVTSGPVLEKAGDLAAILTNLEDGDILFIDEIDASLHSELTKIIIKLFQSPETNKGNAQFVFTTHDTCHLDRDKFRRDEIWFT